jgi:hypothetical protein
VGRAYNTIEIVKYRQTNTNKHKYKVYKCYVKQINKYNTTRITKQTNIELHICLYLFVDKSDPSPSPHPKSATHDDQQGVRASSTAAEEGQ